ncbi:fimbrillin family protein [Parabacteroides sp. PM6-13]|uniref:fimbrillin family protein n=1 Tax=Parabacteroides sp. PM6-13 TaxID=1742408 RepID=UPI0024753D02|nr:fimbrillin family protein [Parabacteroides sp. PM6-13]
MRRMLMLAASAAVMLTSCSNDKEIGDVEGDKNGSEINFRTLIDKGAESRATVTNSENILGFTVSGWWDKTTDGTTTELGNTNTGGYLFNAFDLTRREAGVTDWEYDPKIYWPSSGKGVLFYAYSPASSKHVTKGKGLYDYKGGSIEYTVPDPGEAEAQEDFLLARTGNLNKETVKLNFAHVLSRATFSARKTNTDMTYLIKSVTLVNIKKNGKIDYAVIPTGGSFADEYATALAANKRVVHWTDHATPDGGNDNLSIDLGETPAFVQYDESKFHSILGETNALMVLPQTTKLWDDTKEGLANKGFAIQVEYKAYLDVNDPGTYYAGSPTTWKEVYFPVLDAALTTEESPVAHTFEIGRQYNFALTFGVAEAGGKIGFDVNVGDWSDAPVVEVPQISNYYPEYISEKLAAAVKADYASTGVTLGDILNKTKIVVMNIANAEAAQKELKGIEYFANLETLCLSQTKGLTLDLSKLESLNKISMGLGVSFDELDISCLKEREQQLTFDVYNTTMRLDGSKDVDELNNLVTITTLKVWSGFTTNIDRRDWLFMLNTHSNGNTAKATVTATTIEPLSGTTDVTITNAAGTYYE